jgi:hypothetical protein
LKSMLAGLRSRWITPAWCATVMPTVMSREYYMAFFIYIGLLYGISPVRVCDGKYSIDMA